MAGTQKIVETLHPLERKTLAVLKEKDSLSSITKASGLKEIEAMRALQWLSNKGLVKLEETVKEIINLDKNGEKYAKEGLPEKRLLKALEKKELSIDEAAEKAGIEKQEINICIGSLKQKAAVEISKEGKRLLLKITEQGKKLLEKESFEEQFLKKPFPINLNELKDEERFAFDNLIKRKQIIKKEIIKEKLAELTSKGIEAKDKLKDIGETIDKLTPELITSGGWKKTKLRHYDIKINVPKISGGKTHFVNQAVEYIKQIWLDLGFKEMTGSIIQTSFWDLDSLFVPQDHPAREMQDTFYLKDPNKGKLPKIYNKIKQVHENGADTGSKGWQSPWSEEKAKELLLRTHTTVLSAQTIARLKKEDLPAKFFSVAKVFRNETLSWKHLFEFYQVEGIVVDPNANFKHLLGYLRNFYKKMGYKDVRIRPAHFPYTEPSCEVDVLHPVKNEWIELGGAGIFRPEVVKPLLGEAVPVLAWGQGMDRNIMQYYNITDIRELYKNDIDQLRTMKVWWK
ncbi:phenylalanine--tRNA ligase subunit alpha [Candidatus Woesearchaeota archaeon]|nr:phenylalanine--tRNA ligase subunit alpha [Candidatus Woesearchaeota archaeon]